MIIINNLHIGYGSFEVITNLNLEIQEQSIHGLVGLNGSGKTTLLSSIFGLKKPDSGTIAFRNAPMRRKDIGYLETNNYFYSRITGLEYLSLFCINNKAFNINNWNSLFKLPLHDFIETYSTGMKKKLAFMGIIALDSPVLILDEPFNGIDMETMQQFKLIILALKNRGKTIIITSHILESLTSICDAISYLNDKQIETTFFKNNFATMEAIIFDRFNAENNEKIKNIWG
jgi:ABC-2 type transport system ATP-binding protein